MSEHHNPLSPGHTNDPALPSHSERVEARKRENRPWPEPGWIDRLYAEWEMFDAIEHLRDWPTGESE
jgi:hypothetical protein